MRRYEYPNAAAASMANGAIKRSDSATGVYFHRHLPDSMFDHTEMPIPNTPSARPPTRAA